MITMNNIQSMSFSYWWLVKTPTTARQPWHFVFI
jgi:hypothetical protein